MSKLCAYCGSSGKLTQEHIWPAGIIKRGNYNMTFSSKAAKFFDGDPVISDVCATCNNGVLSQLDDYICSMYDECFTLFYKKGEKIPFKYNYELLTRWLLKISYNSARAAGEDLALFKPFIPYILGKAGVPEEIFSVRVELVYPTKLLRINKDKCEYKEMIPNSVRSCNIQIPGKKIDWCKIRLIAIKSFYFWLIFTPVLENAKYIDFEEMENLAGYLPNEVLEPDKNQIILQSIYRDALSLHHYWYNSQGRAFRDYLKSKNNIDKK